MFESKSETLISAASSSYRWIVCLPWKASNDFSSTAMIVLTNKANSFVSSLDMSFEVEADKRYASSFLPGEIYGRPCIKSGVSFFFVIGGYLMRRY